MKSVMLKSAAQSHADPLPLALFLLFIRHCSFFSSVLKTVFHVLPNITQKTGYAIITPNAKI
jgi:hypothetical protein